MLLLFCDSCETDDVEIIKDEDDIIITKCKQCGRIENHCRSCLEAAETIMIEEMGSIFTDSEYSENIVNEILDLMSNNKDKDV